MSLDIGPALRAAFLDPQDPSLAPVAAAIVAELGAWRGEPAVFAYRPIPDDAPDPVIIINEDAAIGDEDGLRSSRPVVQRDVVVYGRRAPPGDPTDQSPAVERIGYLIRELFHRQKFSVRPEAYSVTDIVARGPVAAPADDDGEIGRLVSLTIRLRRNP